VGVIRWVGGFLWGVIRWVVHLFAGIGGFLGMNGRYFAVLGMWMAFAAIALAGGHLIHENPVLKSCSAAPPLSSLQDAASATIPKASPATTASVTLKPGEQALIAFGRRPDALSSVALFAVTGNANPTPVVLNNFKRSDGAEFKYVAKTSQHSASITASDFIVGNTLLLQLCADRSLAMADPGTYNGNVALVGGGLPSQVIVPVSISLSDTRTRFLVPVYFTLALIVGSIYGWILDATLKGDDNIFSSERVRDYFVWFWSLRGILAVIFGLAAATGVFKAQYLSSDDWGSVGWQYVTLAVSMLGAFVSAATVARVPFSGKAQPTNSEAAPASRPFAG
jgi:hypothetical protein